MRGRFASVAAGGLLLAQGCTSVLYAGPELSNAETATLSAGDTAIDTVDGRAVRRAGIGRYKILPGPHAVEVELDTTYFGPIYVEGKTSRPVKLCFVAEAGHSYRTHPVIDGRMWRPTIIEEGGQRPVEIGCSSDPLWGAVGDGASGPVGR